MITTVEKKEASANLQEEMTAKYGNLILWSHFHLILRYFSILCTDVYESPGNINVPIQHRQTLPLALRHAFLNDDGYYLLTFL
jgi:hypothetical protein